jgi:hypothetical protein
MSETLTERVEELRGWALSRIRHCHEEEQRLAEEDHRASTAARTERRALETVLEMLSPGYVDRVLGGSVLRNGEEP